MTNPSRGELVPGGLAITLIDLDPIMVGSIVELETRITKGDIIESKEGPLLALGNGWICLHPSVPGKSAYADGALIPINPEPDPLEITQQQEQSA